MFCKRLKVANFSFKKENTAPKEDKENENESADEKCDAELTNLLMHLKKGDSLTADTYEIKEGETSPPKRYTSGSIILTMENAGQFIEDEELRAQIKGSGIGTSATRAEILKKLVNIEYLALNKKTQVLTPTQMGEMIYDVVSDSIRPLLNPALTASWEKGLTMVADGVITPDDYMGKLTDFVGRRTIRECSGDSSRLRKSFTRRNKSNPMRKIKNKEEEKLLWKILRLKICMI